MVRGYKRTEPHFTLIKKESYLDAAGATTIYFFSIAALIIFKVSTLCCL